MQPATGTARLTHSAAMVEIRVMILLAPVVDALVVVQRVQGAKDLVAQITYGVVQRLQMLLLLVPLQGELRAQQLATDIAAMARVQRQRQQQPISLCYITGPGRGQQIVCCCCCRRCGTAS